MRFWLSLFAISVATGLPLAAEEPVVEHWTVTAAAEPVPALRYKLFPPLIDQTPGDAALLYLKLQSRLNADTGKQLQDLADRCQKLPANELPQEELAKFFQSNQDLLNQLHRAARKRHCDWQVPLGEEPFFSIRIEEVSLARQLSRLLMLHARWRISVGDFPGAIHSLQSCFALARHVNQGPTLIHGLVAGAIYQSALQQIEFWIQQRNSPNLYWALTLLPQPLVDPRPGFDGEMSSLFFEDPALAALDRNADVAGAETAAAKAIERILAAQSYTAELPAMQKLALMGKIMAGYPKAKAWLLKQGKTEAVIEKLGPQGVVGLYTLQVYRELRDDIFKWYLLPPNERQAIPSDVEARFKAAMLEREVVPLAALLMPAIGTASRNLQQSDRAVILLRTVEALRLQAATHQNQWPVKLTEISNVSVPLDPQTGLPLPYEQKEATAMVTLSTLIPSRPTRMVHLTIAK